MPFGGSSREALVPGRALVSRRDNPRPCLTGDESDGERPAPSEASAAGPVLIVHEPPATCRLCQSQSTSPSPLPDASNEDRYGGLVPWHKYQRIPGPAGLVQKRPVGKQCLVCLNVYKALGEPSRETPRATLLPQRCRRELRSTTSAVQSFVASALPCDSAAAGGCVCVGSAASDARSPGYDAKHGAVSAYVSQISSPRGATLHGQFLAARAVWLQKYRGSGQRLTLQGREEMFAAARSISTVRAEGLRIEQERTFVLCEAWDESVHGGPLDPTKVQELEYGGRLVRGVLLDAPGTKRGELKVIQYGDIGLQDRTEEHAPGGPFAEVAAGHRLAALRGGLEEARRSREALAVVAPPATDAGSVLALLQQAGVLPQPQGQPALPAGSASGARAEEVESSSDEDAGAMRAAARLRSFGQSLGASAGKAAASAGSVGSRGAAAPQAAKRHRVGAAVSPASSARAPQACLRPAPAAGAASGEAALGGLGLAEVPSLLPASAAAALPPGPAPLPLGSSPQPQVLASPASARKRAAGAAGGLVTGRPSATGPPAAGTASSACDSPPAGLVDGRTARIASAVREAQGEVLASLETCAFTEMPGPSLRLGQEVMQELATRSATRCKVLRAAEAKLRTQLGRIGRSLHAGDLQAERDAVMALLSRTQAMGRFNQLARQAAPPPAEWAEAVAALREHQVTLGLCHELLGLRVSILRSVTFGEPVLAAEMFRETSPEATPLLGPRVGGQIVGSPARRGR